MHSPRDSEPMPEKACLERARPPIFSQFRHFPFWRKRFMVPRDFAVGKVILFI
jgi:hypothetical protein